MKTDIRILLLAAAIGFGYATPAAAHPVSLTRSLVHVTPDQVTAKIEVFVEDLYLFHNLKPNVQDFLEPDVIDAGIQKHEQFLLERFVIRDLAGQRLPGRVVNVDTSALPAEGVPLAELMAHQIVFEIQYELSEPPEFLTFSQHFNDNQIVIPAEMRLIVKQQNAPTPEIATLKPDRPETFRYSWTHPPLSAQASDEEWDAWLEQQSQETLGITSYDSVYSFLYIEDREVRHEILIPLLTLEDSVLLARDADDFLDLAEQDAARTQIEAYFTSGNPIAIDGAEVKPVVERCDFFGLDFKDFAQMAEARPVSIASARVGIILSYPATQSPNTVDVTWNRFNNYVYAVDMVVYAYDEAAKVTLSLIGKNNEFHWKHPGRAPVPALEEVDVELSPRPTVSVPVMSLSWLALLPIATVVLRVRRATLGKSIGVVALLVVCAGASWPFARWETADPFVSPPRLSAVQADAVFSSLHANVFRAFDYRDESEIYDALSKSVDGDLLRDLYRQIRQTLEMQEQGGAVSRIRQVNIVDGQNQPFQDEARDQRGFQYRCRWTVSGTVEHWGHIHARTNEYDAVFVVEPRDNQWKITSVELLDQQRVKFETNFRGLNKIGTDAKLETTSVSGENE